MSIPKQTKGATASKQLPYWEHKHFYKWLVVLFAFVLFANTLLHGYNMDDELVTINHRLTSKGISAIPEIFTSPYYEDNQGYAYEYRPVVLASFALEHQLFGETPVVSHFFNILFYSLCCLTLFQVLLQLLPGYSPYIPLAITLLFVSHSSHTEVVCSIKNRDEILALLFALLSFHVALKAIKLSKQWMFVFIPILFTAALMSKTTIVSFALLIPIGISLFTKTPLKTVLAIALLLQTPSYFLLNLGTGFEKATVQLGMAVITLGIYSIANYKKTVENVEGLMNAANTTLFHNKSWIGVDTSESNGQNSFSDFFKSIIPDKQLLAFYPIFVPVATTLLYLFLLGNGYPSIGLIPLFALVILSWKGEFRTSWWATFLLGVVLCINLYSITKSRALLGTIELDFLFALSLTIYLANQLIFGHRSLIIPTLLCLASMVIIKHSLTTSSAPPINWNIYVLILLLLSINRYLRYLFLFILLVHIIQSPFQNLGTGFFTEMLSYVIYLIFLLILEFKRGGEFLRWLCVMAAIFIGLIYQIQFYNTNPHTQFVGKIAETTNQVNPQMIEKQERPLHYTEVCLDPGDPISIRLGTSLEILFHYLKKTVLPYPLAYYYGYKFIAPMKITDVVPLISLLIHLALFVLALYLMHKDPLISFGLLVYLFSIATFSNYMQYIPGMVADRYLLVPSLGWGFVLVGMLSKFAGINEKSKNVAWPSIQPAVKYSFVAVLILYSSLTFSRNFDWKDKLTLFRHDISYVNESSQAHNLLALAIMGKSVEEPNQQVQYNMTREALHHFKRSLEIYPKFFNVAYDIGRVYSQLGVMDSAIYSFEYALTIDTLLPDIYLRLAQLYQAQGNRAKSNENAAIYIHRYPTDYNGYSIVSKNYFDEGNFTESLDVNRKAIQAMPNSADPYINIAYTFIQIRRNDSALIYLELADKVNPGNPNIISGLQQLRNIQNSK